VRGRCPTCNDSVALSHETLTRELECPSCRHQAVGSAFANHEIALADSVRPEAGAGATQRIAPVAEPEADEGRTLLMNSPFRRTSEDANEFEMDTSGPALALELEDDGRTLLMLKNPVALPVDPQRVSGAEPPPMARDADPAAVPEDEQKTRLMGRIDWQAYGVQAAPGAAGKPAVPSRSPAPPSKRAGKRDSSDDARTHLLLDAADLKELQDDEEPALASPWSAQPALALEGPKLAPADEARTHLLLDASDLREEPPPTLRRLKGRLMGLLPHVLQVGGAWADVLDGTEQWALGLVALACGVIGPGIEAFAPASAGTFRSLASLGVWLGLGLYGLAWFGTLQTDDGGWASDLPERRVRNALQLLGDEFGELRRSPPKLQLRTAAQVLTLFGLVLVALTSLVTLLRHTFGMIDPALAGRSVGGAALVAALLLQLQSRRLGASTPLAAEERAEAVTAIAGLPAILDLGEPLPASFIGGHTPVHRVLVALSQWRGRAWSDQVAYREALERHLQRELLGSRIERQKWLGRSRRDGVADLVIDDLVLIEVRRRFSKSAAERATAALSVRARAFRDKPLLLVLFDAPREAVFETDAMNALTELHQRLPVVTARMPMSRA
jgi:hypothetical protein